MEGGGFRLKHYTSSEWSAYIEGRLSAEKQRRYEEHLYGCDECLMIYAHCIEGIETSLVTAPSAPSTPKPLYIEQIMTRVQDEKLQLQPIVKPLRTPTLFRRAVFQYGLAAAITIVLMTTGLFKGMPSINPSSPSASKQMLDVSYTDKLMNKTVAMLDAIPIKAKLNQKRGRRP